MPLQSNDSTTSGVSIPNSDTPTQQQQVQTIVQQPQATPVSVPNVNQVQPNTPAVPSPEVHHTSQSQPLASQLPSVSTTTASASSPAITSLSAAATVIIDGVSSLGDASGAGNGGNEEGER